jgi:hypothetical protein
VDVSRRLETVEVQCIGVLVEESPNEGYCELGEECTALALLDESYAAYRAAHTNRSGGGETGGEG